MNQGLPDQVRSAVEAICELGCVRVNEIIDSLESGHSVLETGGLNASDRKLVLNELKAIMAVYEKDPA